MSDILSINWNCCLFCQEETTEELECPARSKTANRGKGYVTICDNLRKFKESGTLGSNLHLTYLTPETLMNKTACWHKSCRIKYCACEFERFKNASDTMTVMAMKQDVALFVLKAGLHDLIVSQ